MLFNWISYDLNIITAILVWFLVFIFHFKLNLSYFIRKAFKLSQTKGFKLLDCFPCQSFWIALVATFNPVIAMAVYFMAVISDKNK